MKHSKFNASLIFGGGTSEGGQRRLGRNLPLTDREGVTLSWL